MNEGICIIDMRGSDMRGVPKVFSVSVSINSSLTGAHFSYKPSSQYRLAVPHWTVVHTSHISHHLFSLTMQISCPSLVHTSLLGHHLDCALW